MLWCKSFDIFYRNIRTLLPFTKIFLNTVKASNCSIDGKEIFSEVSLQNVNRLWVGMDNYVLHHYEDVIPIVFDKKYLLDPSYPYGGLNEMVHFQHQYYIDLFDKLKHIDKNEKWKNSCFLNNDFIFQVNLIRNGNFNNGKMDFWNNANAGFDLIKIGYIYYIRYSIVPQPKHKWVSMWTDPIEIFGDSKEEYILSCDYICTQKLDRQPQSILAVREFSNPKYKACTESICSYMLSGSENFVESEKVYHISRVIVPKGKWLRVGIHLDVESVGVAVSNLRLVRKSLNHINLKLDYLENS